MFELLECLKDRRGWGYFVLEMGNLLVLLAIVLIVPSIIITWSEVIFCTVSRTGEIAIPKLNSILDNARLVGRVAYSNNSVVVGGRWTQYYVPWSDRSVIYCKSLK